MGVERFRVLQGKDFRLESIALSDEYLNFRSTLAHNLAQTEDTLFIQKIETKIQHSISSLQAEIEMLEPEERNRYGEHKGHIADELALLKRLAQIIEQWNQKNMREAIRRMSLLNEPLAKAEKPRRRTR